MEKHILAIALGCLGGMTSAALAAAKGPVKVFILSGQSNTQGKAGGLHAGELSYTSDKRYHYLGSGAFYYKMGESMGKAMVDLVPSK